MQGRGARHTACSHPRVTPGAPQHTQARTHTHLCPPQTRDSGLQAGRHSLSVTQKRMCEILISVKPQATTFPSINTFSLVPSPVWQGWVKIFHSLKRVLRVYSSRLGRASGGVQSRAGPHGVVGTALGILRTQGSEAHGRLLHGHLQASAFRRPDLTCVLYTGGRPLTWTLVEASRPDMQNPSRFRGIWERPPVAPPPGLDSSPGAPAVSAPGRPWTWGSVQTVPAPRGRSLTPGWLIPGPNCLLSSGQWPLIINNRMA